MRYISRLPHVVRFDIRIEHENKTLQNRLQRDIISLHQKLSREYSNAYYKSKFTLTTNLSVENNKLAHLLLKKVSLTHQSWYGNTWPKNQQKDSTREIYLQYIEIKHLFHMSSKTNTFMCMNNFSYRDFPQRILVN